MNEFWGLTNFNRWLRTPSGRSKRSVEVKEGLYVIIHLATGQFITGHSKTVSKDVDKTIEALDSQKHSCRRLKTLVSMDSMLEILEIKCTAKQCKSNIKLIKHKLASRNYSYLYLGNY